MYNTFEVEGEDGNEAEEEGYDGNWEVGNLQVGNEAVENVSSLHFFSY